MKKIIIGAAFGALIFTSACATVTRGSTEEVTIQSIPAAADVSIRDTGQKRTARTCVTPCTIKLERKWPFKVTVSKDGYETQEAMLYPEMSNGGMTGMAGNVLIGGIIGAGVDVSTGAMNDLKPNPLVVELVPIKTGAQATMSDAMTVAVDETASEAVKAADELLGGPLEVQSGAGS